MKAKVMEEHQNANKRAKRVVQKKAKAHFETEDRPEKIKVSTTRTKMLKSESIEEFDSRMDVSEQYYVNDQTGSPGSSNLYSYHKTPASLMKSPKSGNYRERMMANKKRYDTLADNRRIDTRLDVQDTRRGRYIEKGFHKARDLVKDAGKNLLGKKIKKANVSKDLKELLNERKDRILEEQYHSKILQKVQDKIGYKDKVYTEKVEPERFGKKMQKFNIIDPIIRSKKFKKLDQFVDKVTTRIRGQDSGFEKSGRNTRMEKTQRLKEDVESRYTEHY